MYRVGPGGINKAERVRAGSPLRAQRQAFAAVRLVRHAIFGGENEYEEWICAWR